MKARLLPGLLLLALSGSVHANPRPSLNAADDFIEAFGSSTFFDPLSNDAVFGLGVIDPFSFTVLDTPTYGIIDIAISPDFVEVGYFREARGLDYLRYRICTVEGQCDIGTMWFLDYGIGPFVSDSANRADPIGLSIASLSGDAYLFIPDVFPVGAIQSIRFLIDDEPYGYEVEAPYDVMGGSAAMAHPLMTGALGDGQHSLTTEIKFTTDFGGDLERFETSFTVRNEPLLAFSYNDRRTGAGELNGGFFGGQVYVFLATYGLNPGGGPIPLPNRQIARVRFLLDGFGVQTERLTPYDFAGGSESVANAFNMSNLTPGDHTISAIIDYLDGTSETVTATFLSIR